MTKPKRIQRQHTLRALQEIASGQARTRYAQRLLPYVQEFDREFDELAAWRMAFGD